MPRLSRQAHRLAHSLAALGAGPGRRVAMLLPNIPEYIIALQATWLTGATALQLSPLMVAEEISKWLEATDCHIVVTLDLLAPRCWAPCSTGPLEHVIVASLADRVGPWKGWLYRIERLRRNGPFSLRENGHFIRSTIFCERAHQRSPPQIVPEEDVAVLAPTGGTTASPKAVMLTHRNLVANAFQIRGLEPGGGRPRRHPGRAAVLPRLWPDRRPADRAGQGGDRPPCIPRFEVKAGLNLLEALPDRPGPGGAGDACGPQSRAATSGRATCPSSASWFPAPRPWTRRSGPSSSSTAPQHVVEGYGLSEASPVTHVNPIDERNRPGTIGLPLPDTEARIVDQATGLEELPVGSVGELVVRGPQVMKGYFNNPDGNRRHAARRLAVHRRPGPPRPRRLLHHRGPQEGHHQDLRVSGLPGRGRGSPDAVPRTWPRRR